MKLTFFALRILESDERTHMITQDIIFIQILDA